MKRLVYLIGQPGSGKTTLMSRITNNAARVHTPHPVPRDLLVNPTSGSVFAVELGRQRPGGFSGTDALASTAINAAEPWLRTQIETDLVLAEGARLANVRFLKAAEESGYRVLLVLLDHDDAEAWRESRSAEIGKHQNASWVKGRLTASRNLASAANEAWTVMRGHPNELYPRILDWTKAPG
ncbi:adenylate kinase [Gordonia phage LittleMunchkin]|nr:adenylate kinase [Gordonia phage LittleMunchkin]